MKVKKQRRHRRTVTFYKTCFGFHQPFKVLCDGTFIHHLLMNRITPADKALSNILSATIKLYTTRCVLAELKRLGPSYIEALGAAKQLEIARCEHEKGKSGDVCIMEVIGENNSEHFFVASQDTDLRKKLQEVPGVPLIYGLRTALFLEPLSEFQQQYAKTSEEKRLHMTESEHQTLNEVLYRLSSEKATISLEENKDLDDQTIDVRAVKKTNIARKRIDIKDKVQFKRKKAKGPNPLSCKKKKNHENKMNAPLKEVKGDNTAKRHRKRKRSRKGQNATEADSQL